jgi:hypothetical protein
MRYMPSEVHPMRRGMDTYGAHAYEYTPMRSSKMHVQEVHAHEIPAYEVNA